MVEANASLTSGDIKNIFKSVTYEKVPSFDQMGKPAQKVDAVESLKEAKGKPMSDNAK